MTELKWINTGDEGYLYECPICHNKSKYKTIICGHCGSEMSDGIPIPNIAIWWHEEFEPMVERLIRG